jgi:hypothetical protein
MLSAMPFVAFLLWRAADGASLGGLGAFATAWIVLSALYRRTAVSRRRLHRR